MTRSRAQVVRELNEAVHHLRRAESDRRDIDKVIDTRARTVQRLRDELRAIVAEEKRAGG